MKRFLLTTIIALTTLNAHAKTKWFIESTEDWALKIEVDEKLLQKKTPMHRIRIYQTPRFGKVLVIDGELESTEKDGFIADEMLSHVPLLTHGNAKRVLLIGAIDGGVVRELLKHRSVQEIVSLQEDKMLFDKCKKHLDELTQNSFDDTKVHLVFETPSSYFKEAKETFDIIICNTNYDTSKEFYEACRKLLDQQGILAAKMGSFFLDAKEIGKARVNQLASFKESHSTQRPRPLQKE
jgi:spermidine synthase